MLLYLRILESNFKPVCFYHAIFTLYNCLNVKELLVRNGNDIWNLSDSNGIRTQSHLVGKGTLNHLDELNGWVFVYELSGCGSYLVVVTYLKKYWE